MPTNLPLVHTSFVGRADLVAQLERLVSDAVLVTVVGTGGVGKTRLALVAARRLEDGRRLIREGMERSSEIGDGWGKGMALTVLGLADLRAGYREDARQHLRQALRTNLQAGVTATAVGGLGAVTVDTDARRALTLLEAAVAIRERMGVVSFPVHVARQLDRARQAARRRVAEAVAAQCRDRARAMTTAEVLADALADTPTATRTQQDRLTARQQQIALLVSEGLSNRDIAGRLHLSVRTVETHVDNILSELGFHNRTRLAGWAREVGLSQPTT